MHWTLSGITFYIALNFNFPNCGQKVFIQLQIVKKIYFCLLPYTWNHLEQCIK